MGSSSTAVLLITHGTVADLDDLLAFGKNIRCGFDAPPELLRELRHRYEVIGGSSPLGTITESLARKLALKLELPVRTCMRLWRPYPADVLPEVLADRIVVLPLAQHSAKIYEDAVRAAAAALARSTAPKGPKAIVAVPNWGREPALLAAFAKRIAAAVAGSSAEQRARTALILTAHSLPRAIVDAGDAYEREARAAAEAVATLVRDHVQDARIAFQSQGLATGAGGRPVAWLGPDLPSTLDAVKHDGFTRVVVAPIGFLADHVEILFDLDVEAKTLAAERGLELIRTRSLNDDDDFVDVLALLARRAMDAA
ncbi:ferrochelatase [soil metagenome]